jgi:hypothetical protein
MWISTTPCLSVCTGGICSGTCTPADKQCGMNQTPQTCDGTGAWVDGARCPFVCSGKGVCGGDCTPGARRCDGTTGQVCDGSGHYAASGADCTLPTIFSTSPASNADGVRADASVVIVFSEPMDAASTEMAFTSDLPAHTFSWNSSGRVLTVTPSVPLEYATGADRSVPPRQYSFTVGTGAADRAGNKLATATTVAFVTLRRFVFSIAADDSISGYVGENGDVGIGDGFVYANCAGTTYPSEFRAFLSFDIAGMPDDIQAIDGAGLTLTAIMLEPTQVFPTAPLEVAEVQFSTLNEATFGVVPGAPLGALTRGAGNLWTLNSAALGDSAATAYGSRGTNNARAQYRIRVGADTCEARASFALQRSAPADLPKLSVTYLVR